MDEMKGDDLHIIIDTKKFELHVADYHGFVKKRFCIAIGREESPTPKGQFKVFEKNIPAEAFDETLIPECPIEMYGPRNIDLSICGYDFKNECWRHWSIHGTDKPELIGQAVSAGCIRLTNAEILQLYDMVKVGMEVSIV